MSEFFVRNPRMDEIPLLKGIWSSVFGTIGIDAFFNLFFRQDMCAVVEQNGSLAAMGYLISSGDIKTGADTAENTNNVKCAMIYSVGTLSQCRGLGLGTIVVNNLISLAGELGFDAVVLCPSEEGLFEYYRKRTKLRDWFYINEYVCAKPPNGTLCILPEEISIEKYLTTREKLLKDTIHIKQNEKHFLYQLELCNELGGGFFRIGDSCAVIERQYDGAVWVKELLISEKGNNCHYNLFDETDCAKILAPIADMFPSDKYLIRTPAKAGTGRRFGMLNLCGNVLDLSAKNEIAPWYGMAFD
jgi:hypothetical protein